MNYTLILAIAGTVSRVNDDFQALAALGDLEGLVGLFEREAVRYQRTQIYQAFGNQGDCARVGMLHAADEFDRQPFSARQPG